MLAPTSVDPYHWSLTELRVFLARMIRAASGDAVPDDWVLVMWSMMERRADGRARLRVDAASNDQWCMTSQPIRVPAAVLEMGESESLLLMPLNATERASAEQPGDRASTTILGTPVASTHPSSDRLMTRRSHDYRGATPVVERHDAGRRCPRQGRHRADEGDALGERHVVLAFAAPIASL